MYGADKLIATQFQDQGISQRGNYNLEFQILSTIIYLRYYKYSLWSSKVLYPQLAATSWPVK